MSKAAKNPDTITIRVTCPEREDFPGYWLAQQFWANGVTEADVTPKYLASLIEELTTNPHPVKLSVERTDTGQVFTAKGAAPVLSAYEKWQQDQARAKAVQDRRDREEAERRDRERLEAEARARDAQFAAESAQRTRELEAERERVARILAEEDARLAAEAQRAADAAAAGGVLRKVSNATT